MTFVRPWLLLLLLALPLWWWHRRRAGAGVSFSDVGVAGATATGWWVRLPVTLRSLALAAWIVAAAGPRIGGDRIELKKEGIAIVIAIDIS
ncbi:MAG TPA: BatA domain-containing protein, partial [Gemmatimonadales bacterium]|nr:BatA domain-containing protein [Gemmatimonadales bacterium]